MFLSDVLLPEGISDYEVHQHLPQVHRAPDEPVRDVRGDAQIERELLAIGGKAQGAQGRVQELVEVELDVLWLQPPPTRSWRCPERCSPARA